MGWEKIMNPRICKHRSNRRVIAGRTGAFALGLFAALSSMSAGSVEIAQSPLYLGSDVPGNLALVPSVEFPTAISRANLDNDYTVARTYVGYFDPAKCYGYQYSATEAERHFYPVRVVGDGHVCGNAGEWSGNFMNWAATQTIDPFRKALTGGYRVQDTPTETWVEKAIGDRDNTSNFPRYDITNAALPNATPVRWGNNIKMRIDGLGNKMRFTTSGDRDNPGARLVPYDPATHPLDTSNVTVAGNPVPGDQVIYEVSVRVKVCDAAVGLESNCVRYSQGYKPEGLIQEYSDRIRYSIFGYQNFSNGYPNIDGGILRAQQKFVGPQTHYPDQGVMTNAAREWDPITGVLYRNPDAADATATTAAVGATYPIVDSGVINYLNKFGQMNTGRNIKSYDNVSELYYAAVRYFKNLGNVPAYSNLGAGNAQDKYRRADAFPVITNWNDPIRYSCQTNVILGIGDTNTHIDKNLPGATNATDEPGKPAEVVADTTVDVVNAMYKIFRMEGDNHATATTKASAASFNGGNNSAYIAALAYDSRIRDIRPDLDGRQTLSTHWVDVVEFGDYKNFGSNQYALTGKYGGFRVPTGYDPENLTPLNQGWWRRTTDLVNNRTNFPRPDNYYVAADAAKMVASLTEAFQNIMDEMQGSASSFASNTTKLEVGARTYQAQFATGQNAEWNGQLNAYNVNVATGALTLAWQASDNFPVWGPTNATANARKVYYNNAGSLAAFEGAVGGMSSAVVNYLRGDRSGEQSNGGAFRTRRGLLGDIVNSQPTYVGAPNNRLYAGQSFTGATAYAGFAAAQVSRTPVLYVGANDGMLHAFNANTGRELFAFVPTEGMAKLHGAGNYTDPAYVHKYTVDGSLTAADWYNGTSWKTVVVGTMGRGGKSVFALDVTDPASPSLMWEVTDASLGNNIGQPIVAQVADGDWRVLLGNGPNSTDGIARLVMIQLSNGVRSTITTGVGGDNGLSGINAWSAAGNGIVDTVYGGDLKGNLWRFNPATASASLLYAAGTTKPITATPLVARNPRTLQTWVFVGTGSYLNSADMSNTDVQTWYGLIDHGTTISSGLNSVSILAEGQVGGRDVRVIERLTTTGANGWYMNLLPPSGTRQGERMVVPNFFQGLTLIGTTRIPDADDVCSPSGKGFTMAIDPFTGGRLSGGFFDANGDGTVDGGDSLNGSPVSGIGYNSSPNNPIFLGDVMYTSLDDGTSAITRTNASGSNLRRVSWRELIRD
ncbi:PilC/PilY family type IV pilus protein [Pseudoxanthomonas sp.]|uniref:pilus assembly protein n=1 Tax=Pseudoxanthomonas sp. TaxID=1871049 RepID=UPI0028C45262|nr:PilC/PilY family type IV pilus protein [Pseudoxanthomonas sp.]